jgi:hypothetical protein
MNRNAFWAILTILLLACGAWSLYYPVFGEVRAATWYEAWTIRICNVVFVLMLMYYACRLGIMHALNVPKGRRAFILAMLVGGAWLYWYAHGVGALVALASSIMLLIGAGYLYKEDELREEEMADESPSGD